MGESVFYLIVSKAAQISNGVRWSPDYWKCAAKTVGEADRLHVADNLLEGVVLNEPLLVKRQAEASCLGVAQ